MLASYADGDFSPTLTRLPGKLGVVNDRLDLLKRNLDGLAGQVRTLTTAAVDGHLAVRADAARFHGDWAALLTGLNATLDSLLAPVEAGVHVLEALAQRDLSARVAGQYRGEHARLRDAINATAEALGDALGQVAETVEGVAHASQQIAAGAQAVATGASARPRRCSAPARSSRPSARWPRGPPPARPTRTSAPPRPTTPPGWPPRRWGP